MDWLKRNIKSEKKTKQSASVTQQTAKSSSFLAEYFKGALKDAKKNNIGIYTYKSNSLKLHSMIELPEEVNLSEFIAYKTYMFYGCVNSLKSILDKYCTSALCPKLINNNIQNYHPKLKKSRLDALSAINTILRKTEEDITDEQIFPTDINIDFGPNFKDVVIQALVTYFCILSHMYLSHAEIIHSLGLLSRLNLLTLHMVLFCDKYDFSNCYKSDENFENIVDNLKNLY